VRSVAVAAALLLGAAQAGAVEYELPIDIDGEEDLYELYYSQEISEETFNALLDLLRRGVDVGRADAEELYALPGLTIADVDAIIAYRNAAGSIFDPGALAAAGVISDEKLAAIAPFVIVTPVEQPGVPSFAGRARYRALYSSGDSRLPAMALEARATTLRRLTPCGRRPSSRSSPAATRRASASGSPTTTPRSTRPTASTPTPPWCATAAWCATASSPPASWAARRAPPTTAAT
jgi:hypothetical protein